MPDVDGHELMRRLRRIERFAEAPAIALTGFGRASDEVRAIDAGFDAHLSKPFGLDALIHAATHLWKVPRRPRARPGIRRLTPVNARSG